MFSLFVVAIFVISGLKTEVNSLAKTPIISWLLASISCRNAAWLFVVKWGIWVEKLVLCALRPIELTFGENVALLVGAYIGPAPRTPVPYWYGIPYGLFGLHSKAEFVCIAFHEFIIKQI